MQALGLVVLSRGITHHRDMAGAESRCVLPLSASPYVHYKAAVWKNQAENMPESAPYGLGTITGRAVPPGVGAPRACKAVDRSVSSVYGLHPVIQSAQCVGRFT